MAVAGRLQLTVAVLKPDLLARPLAAKVCWTAKFYSLKRSFSLHTIHLQIVRDMIIQNNFYVVKSRELRWTLADAQNFYSEHKGTACLVCSLRRCRNPGIMHPKE